MMNKLFDRAQETLANKCLKLILQNENYRNLDKVIEQNNIKGVDFILLDLGISSDELDNSGRGFTFRKDEPLLMTMGDPAKYQFTAKDIVNNWDEEVIANIIFGYGEESLQEELLKQSLIIDKKRKLKHRVNLRN
jgi:16S rRNA (cytosine1402-N4)-methyltransferase